MSNFSYQSLEQLRNNLLDTTRRSQFIHYTFPKAKSLSLVNLEPNVLAHALLSGLRLTFQDVPKPREEQLNEQGLVAMNSRGKKKINMPTAEEWAELHNQLDLELLAPKTGEFAQQAFALPTLCYADELDSKLKFLRSQSRSAMEEKGINSLYLTIGFLRCFERSESADPLVAPLYMLPVKLEREHCQKTHVYHYTLSLSGDAAVTNVSLREKLWQEWGMSLPSIEANTLPDDYFQQLEQTILSTQPDWTIIRQASLTLLDFTKQAMYLDLDPAKWTATGTPLESHPTVEKLFRIKGNADEDIGYATEYEIDNVPSIHQNFPLVSDADSSQHSALIDAVNGENLVIEGPPGSGKSQTITNLIAACINRGKKVLFVAEKMAALNVVKARLDEAGLGDFCFELHSDSSSEKAAIAESLKSSYENRANIQPPSFLANHIQSLESNQHQLADYVTLINQQWADSGRTLHEILTRAAWLKKLLPEIPLVDFEGEELNQARITALLDSAEKLEQLYHKMAAQSPNHDINQHPWCGIQQDDFFAEQKEALVHALGDWNKALRALNTLWQRVEPVLGVSLGNVNVNELGDISHYLTELDELQGDEQFALLPSLASEQVRTHFQQQLDLYQQIHQGFTNIDAVFSAETLNQPHQAAVLQQTVAELQALGCDPQSTLETIATHQLQLVEIQSTLDGLLPEVERLKALLPEDLADHIQPNFTGLMVLLELRELIGRLPSALWAKRAPLFDQTESKDFLDRLEKPFNELTAQHNELQALFYLEQLPHSEQLMHLVQQSANRSPLRFCSATWRNAKNALLALSKQSTKLDDLLPLFSNVIAYQQALEAVEIQHQQQPILGELFQGVKTDFQGIKQLSDWYHLIRAKYGKGFGSAGRFGSALITLNEKFAQDWFEESESLAKALQGPLHQLEILRDEQFSHCELLQGDLQIFGKKRPLVTLSHLLKNALERLEGKVVSGLFRLSSLSQDIDTLVQIAEQQQAYTKSEKLPFNLSLSIRYQQYEPQKWASYQHSLRLADHLYQHPILGATLAKNASKESYQHLLNLKDKVIEQIELVNQAQSAFLPLGQVDLAHWYTGKKGIKGLIERNQGALNHANSLTEWTGYLQLKTDLLSQGLDKLVLNLAQEQHAKAVVELHIYHHLSHQILNQHKSLKGVAYTQEASRQQFQKYDRELMALQREQIAFNASQSPTIQGVNTGSLKDYTEMSLILHEAGKEKGHIAIRSLLSRASQSVQALKPCFMMSPMSVAEYLEQGKFEFDLVIMDEASQIPPEEAIGAIARGKSVVIVGDSKQLPPTKFFEVGSSDEERENNAVNNSESILDAVRTMFKNRRLRWHYRSQHESLIAFSNQQFYHSNLVIFPSATLKSEELGIRYQHVAGCYVDKKNNEEASHIVADVIRLVQEGKSSIGVVAMNSSQQLEIEQQLEKAFKADNALQTLFEARQTKHNLFIKNLENVQGDERDVILISMTYGPETIGGKVAQRFGPLTQVGGERRLNVLFTRAKQRMQVYSSMHSSDVRPTETSHQGVHALKAFLEYCETGYVNHSAQSQGVSDFAQGLMTELAKHGYDCVPNVGVAGFFVDVAVKHPSEPNRFILGIECDGASYANAKSTRDRDRLRAEILENLGWHIRRVWSPDWFKHPDSQLTPILADLAAILKAEEEEQVMPVFKLAD